MSNRVSFLLHEPRSDDGSSCLRLKSASFTINRISEGGNAIASVRSSGCSFVHLFPLCLSNRLAVNLELLLATEEVMTIARKGLKVKVKVMGQANAVGPTSIEGSIF